MRGKKGRLGFISSIAKLVSHPQSDWYDPSTFLIRGESLPPESSQTPRYWIVYGIAVLAVMVFGFRLIQLQITQGAVNRLLADGNRVRRQITIAPRGAIVDAKGHELVVNEAGYRFDLIPADLPYRRSDREATLRRVADTKQLNFDDLVAKVNQAGLSSTSPLTIIPKLSREDALLDKVRFNDIPGVSISYIPSRKYDNTPGLAHLIGYTSQMTGNDIARHPDYHTGSPIGRSGVESSYDVALRGEVGVNDIEVNATGQFQRILTRKPPKVGNTLHLTLDKGLQTEMNEALKAAMEKEHANQAVGIAINPQTGGILASVSLPGYDNNLFAKGVSQDEFNQINNDPNKPLLNRALDGLYPAGSTIKPFVAAAALQEGTITAQTTLDTSAGVIEIGDFRFPDWKKHGVTAVAQAIAESNDIMFYALGGGWKHIPPLGVERLRRYYSLFGLGKDTGVDYASESKGLVPDPDWKKRVKKEAWYIGDTYHIAIGQGDLLVTPLQMARALSSLVNGGRLLTPHIVDSSESSQTKAVTPLTFPEEKISLNEKTIATVRDGMRLSVTSDTGSARSLRELPFSSGGKTGTAQFGIDNAKTHAWYIGYAPADNPEIVVVVIVEGGGEGNAISVPVAGRVFNYYMTHK